jgi:hypothetical protein
MPLLKMHSNHCNNLVKCQDNNQEFQVRQLSEGLQYKDLDGLMKPTVHVDEFSSKMGDDADIIVISFFVRDKQAAKDLMGWFEKGYDFVLDADRSPGEIKPNRYLVYVEIRRRSAAASNINELLEDLHTLTEFDAKDWQWHYQGKKYDWDPELFAKIVPMTPNDYKRTTEAGLNEMRVAAGLPVKKIYEPDAELKSWQSAAGAI